jgi:hypothetical protein
MKQSTRPGAGKSVQTEAWKKFKKLWLVEKNLEGVFLRALVHQARDHFA